MNSRTACLAALITLALMLAAGCTSPQTRHAIQGFEQSENAKQNAFNNAYRIASEQLLLSTGLAVRHAQSVGEAARLMQAGWQARQALEDARLQYALGRSYSQLVVGQYLYDQQGFLNLWFESFAGRLKRGSDGVQAANKTAGIGSFWQLVPDALESKVRGEQP